uniref:Prolamin-like domain-containing protein n=1 Tax=Nelumbo nucifera TaxID=4432 RepID=A0A822Y6L9_NELNU|nr:TPA_asm: hypothetical protein HUJ06_028739 [Nelumbo nucifera]
MRPGETSSMLMIIACLAMLAVSSLAHSNPNWFLTDPEVVKCLTSLHSVKGCEEEILSAYLRFQPRFLGPACCKATTEINENCWPKMFSYNPFLHPLLKAYCALLQIAEGPAEITFATTSHPRIVG